MRVGLGGRGAGGDLDVRRQHPVGSEALRAMAREARVLAPLDEVHVAVEDAAEVARRAPHARKLEELVRARVRVRVGLGLGLGLG